MTLRHKFNKTVKEIGEGVHNIKVRSRIAIQLIIYDDICNTCKESYINCRENNNFIDLSGNASQFELNLY